MAAILRESVVAVEAFAPTSNTASHDNREKINAWVSLTFLYGYGALLGGPSGRQNSAIMDLSFHITLFKHIMIEERKKLLPMKDVSIILVIRQNTQLL